MLLVLCHRLEKLMTLLYLRQASNSTYIKLRPRGIYQNELLGRPAGFEPTHYKFSLLMVRLEISQASRVAKTVVRILHFNKYVSLHDRLICVYYPHASVAHPRGLEPTLCKFVCKWRAREDLNL